MPVNMKNQIWKRFINVYANLSNENKYIVMQTSDLSEWFRMFTDVGDLS